MAFRVLYIEDTPSNMQLLRDILALTDYELLEAVNGKIGFETALREAPDLIVMDIGLPDIDGIRLIGMMKRMPRLQNIPIIALTGDTSDEIEKQCLDAGFLQVLHKPVNRFVLLDTFRKFAETPLTSPDTNVAAAKDLPKTRRKVLIVEDNPDLRTIFALTFDKRYFSVVVAVDGVDAIERLEAETPDIMILDINMPRLSGLDVLTHVRQNPRCKQVKVIVVTGNSLATQAPEAEYADLCLVKPVNISDLITLAQRLIAIPA